MNQRIGVLLVNLGTPDSPKTSDVRKYLNEFLTDGRVIDIPWIPRQLLVRGVISPFRAGGSAKSYKEIWNEKGSPLKYISEELVEKVQESLDNMAHRASEGGNEYYVELAMRYQSPNIESALMRLRKKNVHRYIILPLFPHYASSSTGSAHQRVMEIVSKWQVIPSINFINSYYNNPDFIKAFAEIGKTYNHENYDHVLFSFHGLPERHMRKANDYGHCLSNAHCCQIISEKNQFCYSAQCHATAQLLAKELNISEDNYSISYQSRLGKDPWMQPYTDKTLEELAHKGIKNVLVFCPAFVADCLETIFEIGVEYQEEFEEAGGEKVQLVESLNTHPLWVKALKNMILES